jgi:hypothetical protein
MKEKTVQERYRGKNEEEAERCFQQARRVARQQKAKSLELRVAVSLGQSWAAQGKEKEAYLLLNKGYRWFTERFDTEDLQEAKTMLEELT